MYIFSHFWPILVAKVLGSLSMMASSYHIDLIGSRAKILKTPFSLSNKWVREITRSGSTTYFRSLLKLSNLEGVHVYIGINCKQIYIFYHKRQEILLIFQTFIVLLRANYALQMTISVPYKWYQGATCDEL